MDDCPCPLYSGGTSLVLVVGFWILAAGIAVFLAWFFAKGAGRTFIDSIIRKPDDE